MVTDKIVIKGARSHNLNNIDVEIPRDKLCVITGLSGSGKSSLAFDTIYAEGQRRYVESLSSYARMFLGQMDKPDVDYIEGLSPAISIDQKTTSRNPRSTVGTVTEIYDYLRLLYARIGHVHCPKCGKPVDRQTVDQMAEDILKLGIGTKVQILAPVITGKKGEHEKVLENIKKEGFVRLRIDGEMKEIYDEIKLAKTTKHTIEVVVDRIKLKEDSFSRIVGSLEQAMKLSGGVAISLWEKDGEEENTKKKKDKSNEKIYSANFACPDCGLSFEEPSPRLFSFNSPYGACPSCSGLGFTMVIDTELLIKDKTRSIDENCIDPWIKGVSNWFMANLYSMCKAKGIPTDVPYEKLTKAQQDMILYGCGSEQFSFRYKNMSGRTKVYSSEYEGLATMLNRRLRESDTDPESSGLDQYMTTLVCPDCGGKRLKKEVLSIYVGGLNIHECCEQSIGKALKFFNELPDKLSEKEKIIGAEIIKEIKARLGFLVNVGLDYITLSRSASTLSGGEAQRIRLATQIGSSLMGVLYILDEPSIGLHQRDNMKLISTLENLRDIGNTVLVVEHDEDTIKASDYIVDIGPRAGIHGGNVVYSGPVEGIKDCPESITGQYLSGKRKIEVPKQRRQTSKDKWLTVVGASENNLKDIDVKIPLGVFTCITGVSGSGKSSLINEILYKHLAATLMRAHTRPGKFKDILGVENLDKIVNIDQSPIGRSPRSNPATYTGVFDAIRAVFALTPEAKARGYNQGRFSFNLKGGRCEACSGDGIIKIEMHFLSDVYVPCEVCHGKRYNHETLEVKYKGKSIADVLDMTVDEAVDFFENIPQIYKKMKTLQDVGLGYIKLGQPATTLSGGEAQRVKLATELSKRPTGKTIYILDEPTTGLHSEDISKLLEVLHRLVDHGDSVVVIEHNLDVIKTADYIIDLGPEGGIRGGTVVCAGTPEEVADCKESYTGAFLKPLL